MARKTSRVPAKLKVPKSAPKREVKSAFRPWTWIAVLVLAGMISLAIYLNQKQEAQATETEPTSAISYVFTTEDGLPSSIEVKPAEGDAVRLARNAESVWALESPEETEADQGKAEAAATQISTLRILNDEVNVAPEDLGLDTPAYIITIKFTGGSEHILEVGDSTPTQNGYYVRLDNGNIMIVTLDGIDSLLTLASFPPYLSTPTPTPLPPTETPIPPTPTSTPETGATPTP
jgi:hypothetical protein